MDREDITIGAVGVALTVALLLVLAYGCGRDGSDGVDGVDSVSTVTTVTESSDPAETISIRLYVQSQYIDALGQQVSLLQEYVTDLQVQIDDLRESDTASHGNNGKHKGHSIRSDNSPQEANTK